MVEVEPHKRYIGGVSLRLQARDSCRSREEDAMTAVDFSSRQKPKRDYSLVGQSTRWAIETGLASAEWYHSDVPRKTMKALMQRSDGPAIRDTILWIALILGSAAGGIYFWGTLVVRPVLPRLWRALRVVQRLALARMRSWHGVPDAVDERFRL